MSPGFSTRLFGIEVCFHNLPKIYLFLNVNFKAVFKRVLLVTNARYPGYCPEGYGTNCIENEQINVLIVPRWVASIVQDAMVPHHKFGLVHCWD